MRTRWVVLAVLLAACGANNTEHDGIDASSIDAPAVTDAAIDAPRPIDAAIDAAIDARPDAAIDAPPPPDAAIDAPPDVPVLVVTPPSYGLVEAFHGVARLVHVANTGTAAATLAPSVDGDYALTAGTTCLATLDPGQSCDLEVTVTATAIGARTGTVSLGDTAATTVALSATGAGRITVDVSGVGTGRITSDPAGIDCGATCSALFTTPVTLTAAPDGDAQWTGWSGSTFVVTPQVSPTSLPGVWSLPGTLTITAGGDQPFEVHVFSNDGGDIDLSCDGPCTLAIEAGNELDFEATTPAVFGGISGACTSPLANDCVFTTTGNDTVTVTATGDAHLQRAYHMLAKIESGDVLPGGDFVVGTTDGVSRIDATTGDLVWTVPDTGLTAVIATPDDHVVALADSTVSYLDAADGSVVWPHAADDTVFPAGTFAQLAVSPLDGNIAVSDSGHSRVTVYTPAGVVAFTIALNADGLLYRSDGTLDVLTVRNPAVSHTPIDVNPFAPDGTALAKVLNVATHFKSGARDAFALESGGGVASSTTSDSSIQLQLGAPVIVLDDSDITDLEVPLLAVSPDDKIWWGRSLFGARGFTLELFTPALANELSVDSQHESNVFATSVAQRQLRALPDGGVVVFAEYDSDISFLRGAILVYGR